MLTLKNSFITFQHLAIGIGLHVLHGYKICRCLQVSLYYFVKYSNKTIMSNSYLTALLELLVEYVIHFHRQIFTTCMAIYLPSKQSKSAINHL